MTPEDQYDTLGQAYIKKAEDSIYNNLYERPAIKSLLDDIADKNVLEVGCAGGALTEWLISNKAKVTAIDISKEMINYTKKRVGSKATIIQHDLSKPLDFIESSSVDVVVASLVLHYISNWLPVFQEFQRITRDEGIIVISIHHPHADWKWLNKTNYFKKELYEDSWDINGREYNISYYHRTLANIFAIFKRYNFYVDVLLEPFPQPEVKKLAPKDYKHLTRNPHFLFLRLKKIF